MAERWLAIIMLILLVTSTIGTLQSASANLVEKYSPFVFGLDRFPDRPTPDYEVQIVANVTDKFSTIQNATLSYSIDGGVQWFNVAMELIYGTFSDGTYSGSIPSQKAGTEVMVKLYFEDELDYSTLVNAPNYYVETDHEAPLIDSIFTTSSGLVPWEDVQVRSRIQDHASGVKNVTLYYSVDNAQSVPLRMEIVEELSQEGKWDGLYQAFVPKYPEGTSISLVLEAYDNDDNRSTEVSSYVVSTPQEKSLTIDIDVSALEARNIMGPINITAYGFLPTSELYVPIDVSEWNTNLPSFSLSNQRAFQTSQISKVGIFIADGDPWNYPLDQYTLNLTFSIPFNDVKVAYLPVKYDNREMNEYWNDPDVKNSTRTVDSNTVSSVQVTFTRNPFKSIFPFLGQVFAALLLIGSTFILEHSRSQLGNRLVITLGVFAFLFSFSATMDASRPIFAFGLPTLAENMVGQLLAAAVLYTMSSLIAYRWQTIWVDVAFFAIVAYLTTSAMYQTDVTNSLKVLIVIALGYGFLFRRKDFVIEKSKLHWPIRKKARTSEANDELAK